MIISLGYVYVVSNFTLGGFYNTALSTFFIMWAAAPIVSAETKLQKSFIFLIFFHSYAYYNEHYNEHYNELTVNIVLCK